MQFARTRLAPSPTGALHLGHARTFLITWWMARRAGARIVMRMEDLDAGRAKPESVAQAYEDLRWLGMDWDKWSVVSGQLPVAEEGVVQSERLGVYEGMLQGLWEKGRFIRVRVRGRGSRQRWRGRRVRRMRGRGWCGIRGRVREFEIRNLKIELPRRSRGWCGRRRGKMFAGGYGCGRGCGRLTM